VIIAGVAAACLAVLAVICWPGGHAPQAARSARSASSGHYGGLPSWLPKPKVPTGRVVQASAAHPQLAIEGDTVSVHLSQAALLATAVGPQVPEEGKFPVPAASPCSFTVTFTRASGTVRLQPGAFSILDELGQLHHPRVTAQGGGPPPAAVAPGQTVTIIVKDVLPTGSGTLRWAPGTAKPVVSWDFDVEID
jgi:hypothetical protein